MVDYKTMYECLFNAITDVIEILQKAQQKTENLYIENEYNVHNLIAEEDWVPLLLKILSI